MIKPAAPRRFLFWPVFLKTALAGAMLNCCNGGSTRLDSAWGVGFGVYYFVTNLKTHSKAYAYH